VNLKSLQLHLALGFLWVAFGTYHFSSALRRSDYQVDELPRYRVLRLLILVTMFILLLLPWPRISPLARRFVPDEAATQIVGLGITLLGFALVLWARRSLGRYWSDKIVIKLDHQLVQNGPYAYVRHPIYTGLLLAVAGTALAMGVWRGVLALSLLSVMYAVKARKEERLLASTFGEMFDGYRRQTGLLIPHFRARI
jgi:protein-S-isoprenylcysteine O-methyltransferase Ste14